MEKVEWKVEGMNCTNCALTISKYLKNEGLEDVHVNFIGGDVSFEMNGGNTSKESLIKGIGDLGYKVVLSQPVTNGKTKTLFSDQLGRFLFCLPFALVLSLHMLPWHIHFLMNPWVQLLICLPVYILGMVHFGVSAVRSMRNGIPNMNLLISLGATAAFVYSLIGTIGNYGSDYQFYETTATIITLVFLGEWIEFRTVKATQKELDKLSGMQKVMANMITYDGAFKELIFTVENTRLHVGDLVLIKSGEQVPSDCKVLWGEGYTDESLLTGESKPVHKKKKDFLIGGSLLTDGTVKAQVTAVGKETVLSNILNLVKQAQREKPPVQKLADKISMVFVPVVIGLAALTFILNHFIFSIDVTHSLMRSIAVLVISCPCAMGLATPAAIAVGMGRAARNGILFRDAKSLELFKDIRNAVFDKTGTLTKGKLKITGLKALGISEDEFKKIVFSIERFSNHPVARAVNREWKTKNTIGWKGVKEIKGLGMQAEDDTGNIFKLGPHRVASAQTDDMSHAAYLLKNDVLIGWFDTGDEIRDESRHVISYLHSKKIKTWLVSGDSIERCKRIASQLGIHEVHAEKSPAEKLKIIESLTNTSPTIMIGDGINDAPALAKATIGISMSDATHLARQTAQVILIDKGITHLPLALGLGRHTFNTIRQNLFWAFFYNIIAIPVAAIGLLNPGIAALAMGFSDVVLAANSVRLNYRKVI